MSKKITAKTHYIDSTDQEFILYKSGDTYRGEYMNRPGKPDFATNAEAVRKAIWYEIWKEK